MTKSWGLAVLLLSMTVDSLQLSDSLRGRTARDETAAAVRQDSRHQLHQQQQLHQPPVSQTDSVSAAAVNSGVKLL